jgi:stearoyl-CoA desaturase (delta-9 desaturase)
MSGAERPLLAEKSALERRITVAAVIVPFVAFVLAIALMLGGAVSWLDLGCFAVMYALTGFGVTVGFHRLLTHRSFDAPRHVRIAFAVLGSMSVQGELIKWVADHRKHHTFTDEEGDPHSPHLHAEDGWRGVVRGLWHSHIGWMVTRREYVPAERYARDLVNDRAMVFVHRAFVLWVALGLAIPFAAGLAVGGTIGAALTAMLWGGPVRIFMLHHATFSVNSICHMYGGRPFETGDESRNNWLVGLLALGEGWHHNHHAFPTSAKHGLRRLQFDPSWWIIRALGAVRLARNIRTPSPTRVAQKLRTAHGEQLTAADS